MVGRAKSDTKKAQKARAASDTWMERAVDLYHDEQARILAPKECRKGLRQICKVVEQEYYAQYKRTTSISHATLGRLVKGGQTRSESNAAKGYLLDEEVETVINYALEVASRGFPLTHHRLKECVDEICRARLGDAFLESGVGINWTQRFCEKHDDRLQTCWTTPLDNKRRRAVNPVTNTAYFDMLEDILAGKRDYELDQELGDRSGPPADFVPVPILPENIYGMDESGFFPAGSARERVIGRRGQQTQHQQADGGRENTTVVVYICADGTALRPHVIFKGKGFQVKWAKENPIDAS
jgi:hypothetical protein